MLRFLAPIEDILSDSACGDYISFGLVSLIYEEFPQEASTPNNHAGYQIAWMMHEWSEKYNFYVLISMELLDSKMF